MAEEGVPVVVEAAAAAVVAATPGIPYSGNPENKNYNFY